MKPQDTYFLLKKNNRLQTIVSMIQPYVYASKEKAETLRIKQQLELIYLRATPIHSHFNHLEVDCDEEIISFDKFLLANYGFSFLAAGFDHNQKSIKEQILYNTKFPEQLTDEELLTIQKRMNKYHFEFIEQVPNQKAILLLNPWMIENPLRDGEIFKLQAFFDSKKQAKQYIDLIIERQFDLEGTNLTVGDITVDDLTYKTKELLTAHVDIRYKSKLEDFGEKFVSTNKLNEITNGMEILLGLFESVGKKPYEIIELL